MIRPAVLAGACEAWLVLGGCSDFAPLELAVLCSKPDIFTSFLD